MRTLNWTLGEYFRGHFEESGHLKDYKILEFWTQLFGLKVGDRVKWRSPFTIPQKERDWLKGTIVDITKHTITIQLDGIDKPYYYLPSERECEERGYNLRPRPILISE